MDRLAEFYGMRLQRDFYDRPVLTVARETVGMLLVHETGEGICAGRIVETEAYRGPEDRAAHSSRGLTKRTAAMFGPPGHAYVFRLYGTCWAMNLVVAGVGEPHAVLIRAIEPVTGIEIMTRRRLRARRPIDVGNGPGKLCEALAISGDNYGQDLTTGGLYLSACDRPVGTVARSPRINVDYAGEWAAKPWRFYEAGNPHISVKPRD